MTALAPIVLFTFNRPIHTKKVLEALALNNLASESILYVFCDGPKENTTQENLLKIQETRDIVKSKIWCKEVHIIEQEKNKGLANSVIDGVTEIINKYDKVIVLEDDIVTAKGFLQYMNSALEIYNEEEKVGCIHAWNYAMDVSSNQESTFFLRGADCWGWATWKKKWDLFEKNGTKLLENIQQKKLEYSFNRNGTHQFIEMLKDQIDGKNNSWAIRWHASLFLKNQLCLQPTVGIIKNIGLDGSGIHCDNNDILQSVVDYITVKKDNNPIESQWFFNNYKKNTLLNVPKFNIKQKFARIFKKTFIRKHLSNNKPIVIETPAIWSGDYSSWEDAEKNCTGYNENLILEKCKNSLLKVKNGEAVYERDSFLFDKIQYSWPLLAGLQKAAIENNNKLKVVDFGGSLGSTYYQNKNFLANVDITWGIVEQENFVDCGKKYFQDDHLKFFNNVEEALTFYKPNVLILSSVLQYLQEPYVWLEKFNALNIEYIIIDRTAMVDLEKDLLTVQNVPKEIYEASYPSWFLREKAILEKLYNYKVFTDFEGTIESKILLNNSINGHWKGFILQKK